MTRASERACLYTLADTPSEEAQKGWVAEATGVSYVPLSAFVTSMLVTYSKEEQT